MKRVLSGIRATGRLHLGNYLGAVKGFLALQDDPNYETFYTVVDIHATTTPYDPKVLPSNTRSVILDYLACGIDPKKSAITVQSDLADLITQLSFYFSTITNVARMQDLPTFKEKVRQHPKNVTMALLNYPMLMAADILIYKAEMVPVGIDQEPHLEVAREVARRMNEVYGTNFPEPKRFATKGEYIPSLSGEGKMSKSVEGSFINLTDDLKTIKKKLAGVPTDSGTGTTLPVGGVKTLMTLVELFEGEKARQIYEQQYTSTGIRYGELKERLAQVIYKELEPIQKKRKELEAKPEYVEQVLKDGARRARAVAEATIAEVRQKMGLSKTKLDSGSGVGMTISIDDFARVEQRVGLVTDAVNVEKSDKLIKLTVDFGDAGMRTIFTGVRPFGYTPEDFKDKQFLFVFNLAPRKMMNEYSQGMILAVDGPDDKPIFVIAEGMPKGAKVR